jgi:SAM-dependent methyltransferase
LEHIANDLAAMKECYRMLQPGGIAILQVPICEGDVTVEDPSVKDPAERLRRFGSPTHVRKYGLDYYRRLSAAGFEVKKVPPATFLTDSEMKRFGLESYRGQICVCTKISLCAQ